MGEFGRGIGAGYGIAIPVGAIAVLIVLKASRESFEQGLAAGLGAASADLIYATVAVVAGAGLTHHLNSIEPQLHTVAGVVLALIAARGFVRAVRPLRNDTGDPEASWLRTYLRFVGLTLVNPLTVVYFASIVLGASGGLSFAAALAFVAGVALASASWQTLLAATGALAGRMLVDRARLATAVLGYGIILVFAIRQLQQA